MRGNNRVWRSVAMLSVLLFAISLCPLTVLGQSTFTAQLTGVVTDASGAVIPGAKVTLTDEATGVATTSTTDRRGIYVNVLNHPNFLFAKSGPQSGNNSTILGTPQFGFETAGREPRRIQLGL
jgi:hypothetical protein